MTNLIIFLVAVILVIVIGSLTKTNIGMWGFIMAFVLGFTICKLPATRVLANFPTTLFYNFFIACLFYGFAAANGTMEVLAKKLMYLFRNAQWMAPVTLFLSALIISACGSDLSASIILSPIAFGLALQMGFSPFVALVGIWGGSMAVMMFPWTTTGGINLGTMMGSLSEAEAYTGTYFAGATQLVFMVVEFIIICLITKAFKPKNSNDLNTKPEDFNPVQRKTIQVIIVVLVLLIIPSLIQVIAPNPATKWISSNISAQLLWTVGAVVMALLKCGNLKEVLTQKVPWDTIMLVVGMSVLFGLASPMGVVDTLGEILQTVPGWTVPPVLSFMAAFLSFFVSGAIIGPFFIPLAATLAASTGVSLPVILTCIVAGSGVSSVSPVSQGGASALTGCPTDALRSQMMKKQMILGIINMCIYPFYALLLSNLF